MDLYTSLEPVNDFAERKPRKRMRYVSENGNSDSLQPVTMLEYPDEFNATQFAVTVSSSIARFKLHLIRKQGTRWKNLRSTSAQEKMAVGNLWTMLNRNGNALEKWAGEHQTSETTDSFSSVHTSFSNMLEECGSEADLLFIGCWPKTRDSLHSDNWLSDMVSALVTINNTDGTALRIASVVLQLEDWLAADPRPETIYLVLGL